MQADRVAQLLNFAVSAQAEQRVSAQQELRQMETQDGFTAHLMALGACHDLDGQTRWLAVTYLKNQVGRFWKRRTEVPYEIVPDEKTGIRNGCLPLSLDADEKVATQAALVVARIVRFDYPRVWTDIMPLIAQAVEQNMPAQPLGDNSAGIQVTRVLHYCLKELSTKRLLQDKRAFFQVAPAFLSLMQQFWSIHHDTLSSYLSQAAVAHQSGADLPTSPLESHLRGFLLACKVLRRILVVGYARLHTESAALPFVSALAAAFDNYHTIYALNLPPPAATIAARSTYFLGKIIAEVAETHPLAISNDLEKLLTLAATNLQLPSVSSADESTAKGVRLVALRLLKATTREGAFAARPQRVLQGGGAGGDVGGSAAGAAAAGAMVISFVSGERVASLCSGIVLGSLKMEADEAEELLEQGMEAMHAGDAEEENQEETMTVATACIDCILQRAGEHALAAVLSLHAQGAAAAGGEQAEHGAMVREACYHGLGASAAQLIKLRGGAAAQLAEELVQAEARCGAEGAQAELALKRAVWMMGRLVSADAEIEGAQAGGQVSGKLVPTLCQLVAEHPSLAVRVSAASSLSQQGEEAGEVLGGDTLRLPAGDVATVCQMLAEAASSLMEHGNRACAEGAQERLRTESSLSAVRLLHGIALRLRSLDGGQGAAVPAIVLPHISRMWAAVGGQRKPQIMLARLLTEIMTPALLLSSSDAICELLSATVTEHLLAEAASQGPAAAMSLVLLDALVELWLKLMRTTAALTPAQAQLFPIAPALIRVPRGPREQVFRVIEAYLLLGAPEQAAASMASLCSSAQLAAPEMTALELRYAFNAGEVAVAVGPDDTWRGWAPLLVVGAREVFFTASAQRNDALAAAWFSSLAAMSWRARSPEPLCQLLVHINAANASSGLQLSEDAVVEQWVNLWDSLVSLERRRLSCLALSALLAAGFTPVAARVAALLGFASEVVGEELDEPHTPPRATTALQVVKEGRVPVLIVFLWQSAYPHTCAARVRCGCEACSVRTGR